MCVSIQTLGKENVQVQPHPEQAKFCAERMAGTATGKRVTPEKVHRCQGKAKLTALTTTTPWDLVVERRGLNPESIGKAKTHPPNNQFVVFNMKNEP